MTSKVRNTRRSEPESGKSKLVKLLPASLIGLALLATALLLSSVICLRSDASAWLYPLCAYLCCAVSAFPAGCIAAKKIGKSGFLCGLLAALPLCILLLILCLSLYGTVGSGFLIGSAVILFSGALGGIAVLNVRRKRHYR